MAVDRHSAGYAVTAALAGAFEEEPWSGEGAKSAGRRAIRPRRGRQSAAAASSAAKTPNEKAIPES